MFGSARSPLSWVGTAAGVAALIATVPAAAQAPSGSADAHFKRGVELFNEADYKTALIEFRRAYEINPKFQVLYNIGNTCEQLNDYAGALATLQKYLREGGTRIPAGRRDEVAKEIDKLKSRVATLTVTTSVPGVEITIDDVSLGATPLAAPVVVSAGRRQIVATRPGHPPVTQAVELAGGDSRTVALAMPEDAPPPPPPGPPVAPPRGTVPWIPWALTGVFLTGATVTGILALSASSDLKSKLSAFPASSSAIDSAHSKTFALGLTTDVLGGLALVGLGFSIYFTVSPPSPTSADAPAVSFGPRRNAAGAAGTLELRTGPGQAALVGSF